MFSLTTGKSITFGNYEVSLRGGDMSLNPKRIPKWSALLVEWGLDAILKFNGMFALAFWDNKEKRALLARDRYGIKPLYFFQNSQKLVFASEQKALLEQPAFDRVINKKGVLEYFTFQNFFTDQTLLEGIRLFSGSLCNA